MRKRHIAMVAALALSGSLYGQSDDARHVRQDSMLRVGYATGIANMFTGSAKKIDSSQMNSKEQATNALDAIRGRVAGLQVERNGANALSAVRLRGTTSLTGGNDPLIIVDGVMGDLSLLSSIYPTDIESFTILKDASETSQFGSRGAAGVIEVTTLRGKSGQMRVGYNSSVGLQAVYKTLPMLSASDYRSYAALRGINIVDLKGSNDFQDIISRTGFTQQHHLAFYGGTDKSSYRVSLGYQRNKAVVREMGNRTFMSNMNMSHEMFDGFLRIDLGMFGSTGSRQDIFDEQKLFYSAAAWNPTFPDHRNWDGQWDGYPSASQINNPQALLEEKNHSETSHISSHAKLTFRLLPTLKLTLFGAYTYDVDQDAQYLPTTVWNKGQAYRSSTKREDLMGNAILSFKKTFGQHAVDLMGLAEVQQATRRGFYTTATNFSTDLLGYDNLQAGALRPWEGTGSYYEKPKMTSFMGRASYTLADRYIVTLSARSDGSSKFGDNHKWGFFPSISGAWVLSKEKFISELGLFSELKLSAGFGYSGNQAGIDSYTTLQLLSPKGINPAGLGSVVSMAELRNINPDLKWEVSRTFNIGADARMLAGRLLFSLNYYHTKIDDMLYPYSVSVPPFKYGSIVANLGSMSNSGLEISMGGTPWVTKDLELTINGNVTFQSNRLLALNGYLGDEYLEAPQSVGIAKVNGAGFHGNNDITSQMVGERLGVFNLPHCTGITGSPDRGYSYEIADYDGDPNTVDKRLCGQAMPKVLVGTNVSVRYKDFDMQMQMNGAFGHKLFNATSLTYMNVTSFPLYNLLEDAPQRNIQDQTISDYWLERADYVNMDYVTLGWRVPLHKNRYVESMRLSLTMNNVFTITGYSGLTPMLNSSSLNATLGLDDKRSYPLYHTYTLGISLNF